MYKRKNTGTWLFILILIALTTILVIYVKHENKEEPSIKTDEIAKLSTTKIEGTQKVSNIEISNIEVVAENGETKIFASASNNTDRTLGHIDVRIEIMNEDYNLMYVYGYIPEILPSESISINSVINKQIDNIATIEFYETYQ